MKILLAGVLGVLLVVAPSSYADAPEVREVKDLGHGIYKQVVQMTYITYYVDVQTELCFVAGGNPSSPGMTPVPCENVRKRPEWKDIITWANKK